MIKCEVIFYGDVISVNGNEIHNANDGYFNIYMSNGEYLADWRLEEAIQYCLEN